MESIDKDRKKGEFFDEIVSAFRTGGVNESRERKDEGRTAMAGMSVMMKELTRSPLIIRILMDSRYSFEGQVDATQVKDTAARDALLKEEWYGSTFVVPDYAKMGDWAAKFVAEAEKGKVIVAIAPARTNTSWFHQHVLGKVDNIQFIQGRVKFHGYSKQNAFPDMVLTYTPQSVGNAKAQTSLKEGMAIMTSFIAGSSAVEKAESGSAKSAKSVSAVERIETPEVSMDLPEMPAKGSIVVKVKRRVGRPRKSPAEAKTRSDEVRLAHDSEINEELAVQESTREKNKKFKYGKRK
jgi:hypothetical protein